MAKTINN